MHKVFREEQIQRPVQRDANLLFEARQLAKIGRSIAIKRLDRLVSRTTGGCQFQLPEFSIRSSQNHSPQPIGFTALGSPARVSNLRKPGSEYQDTDQSVKQEQLRRVRRR